MTNRDKARVSGYFHRRDLFVLSKVEGFRSWTATLDLDAVGFMMEGVSLTDPHGTLLMNVTARW